MEVLLEVGTQQKQSESFKFFLSDTPTKSSTFSRWTIWPSTIERRKAAGSDKEGVLKEGDYNVPDEIMAFIKGNHHQFYGAWRSIDIDDDLEKWTGYKGDSIQVNSQGKRID